MKNVRYAFLQRLCECNSVAKQTTGPFRTARESLEALLRLHVMLIRDFFFNLNWNITNTNFPLSMPRIAAVNEREKFSKALKSSQILVIWPPVLSSSYDVWGGTHAPKPLQTKENLHHIHILPHRDAWDNVLYSKCNETFFFTDSLQQNRHR